MAGRPLVSAAASFDVRSHNGYYGSQQPEIAMRTMSAKDAKNHFGELLMEAQKAPVTIEKNGKPVAVVYSFADHHHMEQAKLAWLKAAIVEADADIVAGRVYELDDELMAAIKADGPSHLDEP
jgi:prevent-host-death family protein